MKKRTVTAVVAACALCICLLAGCSSTSSSSSSGTSSKQGTTLDFTLENATGFDLYSVKLSAADDDSWDDNLISGDVLSNGESLTIQQTSSKQSQLWDIKVAGENEELEFYDLDLPNLSMVTLTIENGTPKVIFS